MNRRTQAVLVALGVALAVVTPAVGSAVLAVLDGGKSVGTNVAFNKSDGPRVVAGEEFNFTTENPWTEPGQITLQPYLNVSGPAGSQARLDQLNGTWTNLSNVDTAGGTLTVAVNDKQRVDISGGTDSLAYRNVTLDDGVADVVYAGPDGGTTTLTLYDVPASAEIAAVDASGDVLDVETATAGGVVTFTLAQSEHTVRLQTTAGGPTVDNSSLAPNSSDSVDDPSAVTLEASIDDPDFPDDEVTVEFYVDGSKVGEDTLQSAGTASYTYESTVAGEHEWSVVATDAYGQSQSSATATFGTPAALTIANESAPTELVDNATVELRYYFDETDGEDALIVERNTSDGTINMTGLPGDEPFVVVAEADGYYPRRIFVSSLFETQRVFLLPENKSAVSVRFELQDYSGNYPADTTVLEIQRALNGTWQTVTGDRFGATGSFPAQLRYNTRHRLIVRNVETGESRILGSFTPLTDSVETISIRAEADPTIASPIRTTASPSLRQLANDSSQQVRAVIADDEERLTSWEITMLYGDGGQPPTQELASTSGTDPSGGELDATLNLSGRAGGTILVRMNYTLDDGRSYTDTARYRVTRLYGNQYGLLPVLGTIPTRLPGGTGGLVTSLLAVLSSVAVMGAIGTTGASTEAIGGAGVLAFAAFAVIGWISYGPAFAAGVAWAGIAGLRRVV